MGYSNTPERKRGVYFASPELLAAKLLEDAIKASDEYKAQGFKAPEKVQVINAFFDADRENLIKNGLSPDAKIDEWGIVAAALGLTWKEPDSDASKYIRNCLIKPLVVHSGLASNTSQLQEVDGRIISKVKMLTSVANRALRTSTFGKTLAEDKFSENDDGNRLRLIRRRFQTMRFDEKSFQFDDVYAFYYFVFNTESKTSFELEKIVVSDGTYLNERVLNTLMVLSGAAGWREEARLLQLKHLIASILPQDIKIRSVEEDLRRIAENRESFFTPEEKTGLLARLKKVAGSKNSE